MKKYSSFFCLLCCPPDTGNPHRNYFLKKMAAVPPRILQIWVPCWIWIKRNNVVAGSSRLEKPGDKEQWMPPWPSLGRTGQHDGSLLLEEKQLLSKAAWDCRDEPNKEKPVQNNIKLHPSLRPCEARSLGVFKLTSSKVVGSLLKDEMSLFTDGIADG